MVCSDAAAGVEMAGFTAVQKLVIISTCNRIELVATVVPGPACPRTKLLQFMSSFSGLPVADFVDHTFSYAEGEVVEHLFRVAAGLDSLVLGEPQILSQVTDAYYYTSRPCV